MLTCHLCFLLNEMSHHIFCPFLNSIPWLFCVVSRLLSILWASLVAQLVKNLPAMRETWVQSLSWEDAPGERKGYLIQYSGLENYMDCRVYEIAKSRTRLSNFHFHFIYSRHKFFIRHGVCKYFLPVCNLSFHSLNKILHKPKDFNFDEVQFINFFLLHIMLWYLV